MSDPATLTPPADAPLPYRVSIGMEPRIYDATDKCFAVGVSILDIPALAYLVSAANAAPGLVAERDALLDEHTRDAIASQERIAAEQDANRELRRLVEAAREEAATDRHDAAVAYRERAEGEAAMRTVERERDTALARVAELEAQLAKQAPVIAAGREQAEASDVYAASEGSEAWNDDAFLAWQAKCEVTERAIRTLETP